MTSQNLYQKSFSDKFDWKKIKLKKSKILTFSWKFYSTSDFFCCCCCCCCCFCSCWCCCCYNWENVTYTGMLKWRTFWSPCQKSLVSNPWPCKGSKVYPSEGRPRRFCLKLSFCIVTSETNSNGHSIFSVVSKVCVWGGGGQCIQKNYLINFEVWE
jgi:hypothetical protein